MKISSQKRMVVPAITLLAVTFLGTSLVSASADDENAHSSAAFYSFTTSPAVSFTTSPAVSSTTASHSLIVPIDMMSDTKGSIDERTGFFDVEPPAIEVPGINGTPLNIGLTYRQEIASQANRSPFTGWAWTGPFITMDGGIRVFLPSGGSFEFDASQPSGLTGYPDNDVVCEQVYDSNVLPEREGVSSSTLYDFLLKYPASGVTYYFGNSGNPVAVIDKKGNRVDWIWENHDTLASVIDSTGARTTINSTPTTVEIANPEGTQTVYTGNSQTLTTVTTAGGEQLGFDYDTFDAEFGTVISTAGSLTSGQFIDIVYQRIFDLSPYGRAAVYQVSAGDLYPRKTWTRTWRPCQNIDDNNTPCPAGKRITENK